MASATQTGVGPTGNITAPSGTLVTSWALRSFIENEGGYGWTFESGTYTGNPSVVAEIRASDGAAKFGSVTTGGKLKVKQAGTGTSNSESAVAALSGQSSSGNTLDALSLVNSITAAYNNGVALAFHTASSYSPTGKIITRQEGSGTVTDSRMIFQIYRGSLQDAMILDHDENLTVGGKVIAGTVPRMYTSSDRGYFVAGTNDASNQHLYLGSYHGSTLRADIQRQ